MIPPLAGVALALVCAGAGCVRYTLPLAPWRHAMLLGCLSLAIVIAWRYRPKRNRAAFVPHRIAQARTAAFVTAVGALVVTTAVEAQFITLRQHVLSAPPADLARVGRHIMVGFDDPREVRRLIEARAISGVFVGYRNVGRRSASELKALIGGFQEARAQAGDPPLWIAADQEGGLVQRLSPPLPRQPPLSRVLAGHDTPVAQETAITSYGRDQGRALASIGVNVNFAPVADVDFGVKNPDDRFSRISRRAISNHPGTVAQAASWYCAGLRQAGVRCTRKHFPGLGRVFADTHVKQATLAAPLDQLRTADWVPFDGATSNGGDWAMVGHVRVAAIDPLHPASASARVITVLREELQHKGVVITDDLSMGAVRKSTLGAGGVAVEALAAGVDMLLVSFDPDQIYIVLHALLAANAEGRLDAAKLERSAARLTSSGMLAAGNPATGSGVRKDAAAGR